MKRSLLVTCALAQAAFALEARAQDEKKVVAVMPFGSPNDHSLGKMGDNAQPTFITELVKSKKVRVVDEKRMQDAVKRFERDMTGLMDQKKVKQIGQFLKADYVVAGQLSYTGDAFTMTVHVTNVETLELEMAEDVDFRNAEKMRVAVRTSAKKIADLVSGQQSAAGKHEAFLNIDARHFYDTAEACIGALRGLDAWRYEGEIDSEDPDTKTVHVKLKTGKPKAGMPLQVFEEGLGENDAPIGVVYVMEPDEKGNGFVAKWIKEKDKKKKKKGDFGLGARVSNARYKYRIAIGKFEDEAEDNAQLVEMFRDKLAEKMDESANFEAKTESDILRIANDLGRGSARKDKLEELHKLGVDFLLEGKFIGDPGRRRADFKVISAATGEEWGTLKFETRI
jgi:TolB-like protein